jgi:DNA processing protein
MLGVGPYGPLGPRPVGLDTEEPIEAGPLPPEPDGAPRHPSAVGLDRLMIDDERLAWAVLASIVRLEPPLFFDLVRSHGSARAVLEAAERGPAALAAGGPVGPPADLPDLLARAVAERPSIRADIARLGLTVLTADDAAYPSRLRAIDLAPPVLFVLGDPAALDAEHSIAVVGTRRPTETGRLLGSRIAGALARLDAVVVSGLAIGIDGAAHAAAVAEGGSTVAVIAGGHDRLYPSAHQRLAREIVVKGGVIVSEMAPRTAPLGAYFIRRNRLIAGLADATVVVEAGHRSGALSTARWALEQGRECFLVPGPIDAPASAGCLALLRNHAPVTRIVAGVGELLVDLGLLEDDRMLGRRRRGRAPSIAIAELGAAEAAVARQLLEGRTTVDEIAASTGLPVASVLGTLTLLEMRDMVTGVYGRYRPTGRLATSDVGG